MDVNEIEKKKYFFLGGSGGVSGGSRGWVRGSEWM